MYAGFNLKIDDTEMDNDFMQYEDRGRENFEEQKNHFRKKFSKYIFDGIVDGTKVEHDWFPNIDADVFISHSHKDEKLAFALAGWLDWNFGLKSFIDSGVWGYVGDLLKKMNDKYSNKRELEDGALYDYEKCNTASEHANMMLSIALQKMIDRTEAVIFLNTPNSIDRYEEIYDDTTYSPWIYSEIICSRLIRRKKTERMEPVQESNQLYHKDQDLKVKYYLPLNHLQEITAWELREWERMYHTVSTYTNYKNPLAALDKLYDLVGITEDDFLYD